MRREPSPSTNPHHARRWLILAVIGIAQLMVILDNSIVNIALPSAQADLGFDDAQRQWIITAYALAFGSLLLLGGRLSDLFGRKRAFLTGLVGFAVASILGGLAPGARRHGAHGALRLARITLRIALGGLPVLAEPRDSTCRGGSE